MVCKLGSYWQLKFNLRISYQPHLATTGSRLGLNALCGRMMGQISKSDDAALCRSILAATSVVRRPITLDGMEASVEMPRNISGNQEILVEIVGPCGSFLILRERTISFVHQSAKNEVPSMG